MVPGNKNWWEESLLGMVSLRVAVEGMWLIGGATLSARLSAPYQDHMW